MCDVAEITVGRQHHQIVPDAELGEQRVNAADLHAVAAARGAECGRIDMVIARRDDLSPLCDSPHMRIHTEYPREENTVRVGATGRSPLLDPSSN